MLMLSPLGLMHQRSCQGSVTELQVGQSTLGSRHLDHQPMLGQQWMLEAMHRHRLIKAMQGKLQQPSVMTCLLVVHYTDMMEVARRILTGLHSYQRVRLMIRAVRPEAERLRHIYVLKMTQFQIAIRGCGRLAKSEF